MSRFAFCRHLLGASVFGMAVSLAGCSANVDGSDDAIDESTDSLVSATSGAQLDFWQGKRAWSAQWDPNNLPANGVEEIWAMMYLENGDIVSLSLDGQLVFASKAAKFSASYLLPPLSPGSHTFTLVTTSATGEQNSDDFAVTAN